MVAVEHEFLLDKAAGSVKTVETSLGAGDVDLGELKVLMSIWVSFSTSVLKRSSFLLTLSGGEPTVAAVERSVDGRLGLAETVCGPFIICFEMFFRHETRWATCSCFSASNVDEVLKTGVEVIGSP